MSLRSPLAVLCVLLGVGVVAPRCASAAAKPATSARTGADAESLKVADELLAHFERSTESAPSMLVAWAQRANAIHERLLADDDPNLARSRSALGRALGEAREYGKAISLIRRAIVVFERPDVRDSANLSLALNGLGYTLTKMGDLDAAEPPLRRALAIREAHYGSLTAPVRITLNNLANILSGRGDLEGSKPIYERLVAVEEAQQPPDSARLGTYVNNLANVVSDLHEHARGKALYQRALAIRERVYGPHHLRVATTLNNMASLAEVMYDDSLALVYITRALDIGRDILGEHHPQIAEWITTRSAVLSRLGQSRLAYDEALRGEALSREHLLLSARSLTASEALAYEEFRLSGLHVALCEVAKHGVGDSSWTAGAYDALVRSRSLMLDEMAARRRSRGGGHTGEIAAAESAWDDARQEYANLALRGLRGALADSSYRKKLDAAREQAEVAESRLMELSATFRAEEQQALQGSAAVLAALPRGAALVSYVRHGTPTVDPSGANHDEYLAIVARRDRALVPIALGPARAIDSLVTRWRTAVASCPSALPAARRAEAAYRAEARRLRAAVWDPLAAALAGAERVFIVPDGALHFVNFATLPEGNGYLADRGPLLHVLSTERDLALPAVRPDPRARLLVIGGVNYDSLSKLGPVVASEPAIAASAVDVYRGAAPDCRELSGHRFVYLRGSEREAREVADLWEHAAPGRSAARRFGSDATETDFKRHAGDYEAIHVASHGFFVDPACLDSTDAEDIAGNPLLLSGLVLGGANRRAVGSGDADDGLLTAEEIAALDLSRARWVVLSACGTGLGKIVDGEGVFGLRRAFEVAGAGTLVMSLWDVGDFGTREWMRALYEARTLQRLPASEAMRAASRSVLRDLRARGDSTHPARWGAFIACGDWR